MAKESVRLNPWALTDVESARDYMKFSDVARDSMLTPLINQATAIIERRTARKLKARPFLNTITVADVETATASDVLDGTFTNTRAGMTITCVGVPSDAFVMSVADDFASAVISAPATATTSAPISAALRGHGPLVANGSAAFDANELTMGQAPITEVVSVKSLDDDGTRSAIDITGYRTRGTMGISVLLLPNGVLPLGQMNVEVECVAGYSGLRHQSELDALQHACHRMVQVMWQDYEQAIGRGSDVTVQGFGVNFIDSAMPKDVADIVDRFRRCA